MNKVVGILKLAWKNCTPAVAQRTQALKISEVHPMFCRVNFALLKGKKNPTRYASFQSSKENN